ncbi:M20/M25/M40 family metallo-hydrolase [Halalkalibacillus halophilus]|uniref:M20/M25/M40 family metallo-hydrolase n=1 Tax=Halalkalibacillus halophilus TaxID=392827 RepID=UPI000414CB45|nr:M20/M25/M40 family metallo-hydrolase [Halalkalibacillus halophilus]
MEAKELLIQLVQAKTVNDEQNEWVGIDVLGRWLTERGLHYDIYESPHHRPNLVAKITKTTHESCEPPLILLSHMDVVATNDEEWTYPPFQGIQAEGAIWGRGTLDTKQLTAMHAEAFYKASKQLNRTRDIYFIVTADEENGSKEGMEFLSKAMNHIFTDALVLSEGGGFLLNNDLTNESYMLYANSEKGSANLRLSFEREGGHAAAPPNEFVIVELIETINYLAKHLEASVENQDLFGYQSSLNAFLESSHHTSEHELASRLKEYMKNVTMKIPPFKVGGNSVNVLPTQAEITLELRVLPEMTASQLEESINCLLDRNKVSWEIISFHPGYQNQPRDSMVPIFEEVAKELGFHGEWIPFTALGRTDGRFIAKEATCIYGISPTMTSFTEVLKRVHQTDERIEIDSFEFGSMWMDRVVARACE